MIIIGGLVWISCSVEEVPSFQESPFETVNQNQNEPNEFET